MNELFLINFFKIYLHNENNLSFLNKEIVVEIKGSLKRKYSIMGISSSAILFYSILPRLPGELHILNPPLEHQS